MESFSFLLWDCCCCLAVKEMQMGANKDLFFSFFSKDGWGGGRNSFPFGALNGEKKAFCVWWRLWGLNGRRKKIVLRGGASTQHLPRK